MKKIIVLLVGTLFLTLSGFSNISYAAGEYLGGKWGQSAVYYNYTSSVSSYHTPIIEAADRWNGKATINLRYGPVWGALGTTTQITVDRVPTSLDAQYTFQGYYGFGIPNTFSGNYSSAQVLIVRGKCDPLTATEKRQVLVHEFGHVLGLAHVTAWFTDSVMDEDDVFDLNFPTTYDITNLQGLYP